MVSGYGQHYTTTPAALQGGYQAGWVSLSVEILRHTNRPTLILCSGRRGRATELRPMNGAFPSRRRLQAGFARRWSVAPGDWGRRQAVFPRAFVIAAHRSGITACYAPPSACPALRSAALCGAEGQGRTEKSETTDPAWFSGDVAPRRHTGPGGSL